MQKKAKKKSFKTAFAPLFEKRELYYLSVMHWKEPLYIYPQKFKKYSASLRRDFPVLLFQF